MSYSLRVMLVLISVASPVAAFSQTPETGSPTQRANDRASHMIEATGSIVALKPGVEKIRIAHDPIAALQWPTMTMDFPVSGKVPIEGLNVGDRVQFTLHRVERGVLPIVEICKTATSDVVPGLCLDDAKNHRDHAMHESDKQPREEAVMQNEDHAHDEHAKHEHEESH